MTVEILEYAFFKTGSEIQYVNIILSWLNTYFNALLICFFSRPTFGKRVFCASEENTDTSSSPVLQDSWLNIDSDDSGLGLDDVSFQIKLISDEANLFNF